MSNFAAVLITFWIVGHAMLLWTPAGAANILVMLTIPGKSHWVVMRAVVRELTDRGHTVTAFTPFPDGDRDGYTEVDMSEQINAILSANATFLVENLGPVRKGIWYMMRSNRESCNAVYGHRRMADILDGVGRKFDLVVTEPFMSECVAYAATVLRVPMVYIVPFPKIMLERPFTGHVSNPSTVGHLMFGHGVPKTFAQRFANVALTVYYSAFTWYFEWQFRRANPQPYDAVDLAKPSLIFINTHFITDPPRPLTPDVVQIGGIHLTRPEPIPKDILEFIDDAPHGVIYFTFGSMMSMSSLPENVQHAFQEVFARLPQKVLWKYEGEMKDKPKNVMTSKWFPQRDILLHPNVKLFISHGGISGVYEAVDAGVPILGFSIFNDQSRNIENLVDAGIAISMDLFSITEDMLFNAVQEIFNNERYQKNAKIVSEQFKDRPMSPAELVVYWTEYVLRHKGAPHLKSRAVNLKWYQYFLVDVNITFLFIVFGGFFMIYYVLKMTRTSIFTYFHCMKAKRE